jgi:hypothetical protein
MVTAGVLSVLYIYALANFATCIAYTVIVIIELFIVVYILLGLIGGSPQTQAAIADAAVSSAASTIDQKAY